MSDGEGDVSERVADTDRRECPECGERRAHEVSILVEEETAREDVREGNEKFARHPRLVYRCEACGHAARERR